MFTLGTDPEFLICDPSGQLKNAASVIPGTKEKRYSYKGHEFFHDDVLAEIAIFPASSKSEFILFLKEGLSHLLELLGEYVIYPETSGKYPKAELMEIPTCEPEECAYTLSSYILPVRVSRKPFRAAGGHLHIGWSAATQEINRLFLARMLDLFVGIPSIYLDSKPSSIQRKALYGHAGRYRRASYGMEYRTLGNFWLFSPALASLIYDLVEFTIEFLSANRHLDWWQVDYEALDNDDNWNQAGWHPAQAHVCLAYDAFLLRSVIQTGHDPKGYFKKFISQVLPSSLIQEIEKLSQINFTNIREEWKI